MALPVLFMRWRGESRITHMDPLLLGAILFVVGVALLVAEAVLPSHGIIGAMAGAALLGTVICCFRAGPWLGVSVFAVFVLASPFVFMGMMHMWPKTPVGRRLVLNATVPQAPKSASVAVGSEGRTVTELRPIGECDFGNLRAEVISEYGIIAAGSAVRVVAHGSDGRPVVVVVSA